MARETDERDPIAHFGGLSSAGYDDWGMKPEVALRALRSLEWLFRGYFRVKTHGIEHVPEGRVLLIGNHGGQFPLDGLLITMAMALEAQPPRIVRAMVERWFPVIPFVSIFFSRCGQVIGDPKNCVELLEREHCVLVFPEGARGTGKSYWKRYRLQRFGTGFLRLALETKTPIVPVGVVGAEETYPALFHLPKSVAKALGVPYFPVTPFFPFLGSLGLLPVPMGIDLFFGKPLRLDMDPDAPDRDIDAGVDRVKQALQELIDQGISRRPALRAWNRLLPRSG